MVKHLVVIFYLMVIFLYQVRIQRGGGVGGPDLTWKITGSMGFYTN